MVRSLTSLSSKPAVFGEALTFKTPATLFFTLKGTDIKDLDLYLSALFGLANLMSVSIFSTKMGLHVWATRPATDSPIFIFTEEATWAGSPLEAAI